MKPARREAYFSCLEITVEHSVNFIELLCRAVFGPYGRYTNFIHFDSDIRTCLNPLSSQYIAHASTSIVGKVSIFTWTADTVDTPYKTGDTAYENGFCLTYDSGSGWFTQVAMAVGDSHLFTRHCRGGGWSGWTTIGAPVI